MAEKDAALPQGRAWATSMWNYISAPPDDLEQAYHWSLCSSPFSPHGLLHSVHSKCLILNALRAERYPATAKYRARLTSQL